MTSFKLTVVLCRIRLFPTLISKIKWLEYGLPLNKESPKDLEQKYDRDYKIDKNQIFKLICQLYYRDFGFQDRQSIQRSSEVS